MLSRATCLIVRRGASGRTEVTLRSVFFPIDVAADPVVLRGADLRLCISVAVDR